MSFERVAPEKRPLTRPALVVLVTVLGSQVSHLLGHGRKADQGPHAAGVVTLAQTHHLVVVKVGGQRSQVAELSGVAQGRAVAAHVGAFLGEGCLAPHGWVGHEQGQNAAFLWALASRHVGSFCVWRCGRQRIEQRGG